MTNDNNKYFHLVMSILFSMTSLTIFSNSCLSQSFDLNIKVDNYSDTLFMTDKVIVFEKKFDHDMKLTWQDSIIFDGTIKTNHSTERIGKNFYLKDSKRGDYFTVNLGENYFFKIMLEAPKYVYLSLNNEGNVYVYFSNEIRNYR